MASEILIPVRRRHAATRAQLETMVTYPQHWGYAEDEELTLTRLISGARRYSSRSALCRPQTMFDPVVNVDTHDCVGINTLTQLNNVGSAAGDFYVDAGTTGLHIKSRQTTYGDTAFLILEGYGEGSNGHAAGYDGTKLIMCSSISAANGKMFLIGSGAGYMHFDSLNDDKTVKKGNILTLDGTNSYIGIGRDLPGYALDIYRVGVVKQVLDLIRITNNISSADMIGTGAGIKFELYAFGSTVVDSGKISVYCEQNMTATASTRDTTMAFATCLNDVLTNKVYIDSAGIMGVGLVPWTTWNSNANALQVGKLGSISSNIAESGRTSFAHNIIVENGQWSTKSSAIEGGGLLALEGNSFIFYNTIAQVAGAASLTNRFHINDNGVVGIGIIPWTTWWTSLNCLQVGKLGALYSNVGTSGNTYLSHNILYDGANLYTKSTDSEGGGLLALTGNELYFTNVPAQVAGIATGTLRFNITSTGNLQLTTDNVQLQFGASQDVKLIHIANTGLRLRSGVTTTGAVFSLETNEDTVVVSDVLGQINFSAPLEASGGDSLLVGASIAAIAEDTFSATVNKTSLCFQTGISEVASTKMILNSAGNLGIGAAVVFDTSAVGCLALANATAPGAHTDNQIYMYSIDATVGVDTLATLALYLEHPIYTDNITPSDWIPIVINGTTKALILGDLPV